MATQQAIASVQQYLPSWASTLPANPWTTETISNTLDTNCGDVYKTVRAFWVQRVSDLQPLTDVREADSGRPLSQNFDHAFKMLTYWDAYLETSHETKFTKIKRRYRKPRPGILIGVDPFGFGSPYARTD